MYRFVEREEHWAPPHNYHFSQVLWRASTHVGCAESKGTTNNGTVCRYQVCQYARAGNCAGVTTMMEPMSGGWSQF